MLHNAVESTAGASEPFKGLGSFHFTRMPYKSLDHTLEQMKALVQNYRGNLEIRQKAVDITQDVKADARTGFPNRRDYHALAEAVYSWMKRNIQYVRDPYQIELLQSPIRTLQLKYGDCDDHSILAAALLSSLGVPTRFKVVKTDPTQPDNFTHVYVEYNATGQWRAFDPTLHTFAGDEIAEERIFGEKYISLADGEFKKPCNCKKMSNLISQKTEFLNQSSSIFDINSGAIHQLNDGGLGDPFTAIALASGATSKVVSLFRKNKKALTDCGEAQREVERAFREYFTASDLQTIAQWHTHGKLSGSTAGALAFHYLGGDDCKVTSSGGKAWTDRVTSLLEQRITESEAQAAVNRNGSGVVSTAGASLSNLSPTVKYAGGGLLMLAVLGTVYSITRNAQPGK